MRAGRPVRGVLASRTRGEHIVAKEDRFRNLPMGDVSMKRRPAPQAAIGTGAPNVHSSRLRILHLQGNECRRGAPLRLCDVLQCSV
jgi:hypothetical protein